MRSIFNGRPIEITHVNSQTFDSCDAFVEGAHYLDGDLSEITDDAQLDAVTAACAAEVYEMWAEWCRDRAEWRAECLADDIAAERD